MRLIAEGMVALEQAFSDVDDVPILKLICEFRREHYRRSVGCPSVYSYAALRSALGQPPTNRQALHDRHIAFQPGRAGPLDLAVDKEGRGPSNI